MENIQRIESGPRHLDRTVNHWTECRQIECERRHREAFDADDLIAEVDAECAILAREGKALELGLRLVKLSEATIQRRTNGEIFDEVIPGTASALNGLSIRRAA